MWPVKHPAQIGYAPLLFPKIGSGRVILGLAGELDDRWSRLTVSASYEAEIQPRTGGKSGHHFANGR